MAAGGRLIKRNPWLYLALTSLVFFLGSVDALENSGTKLAILNFIMSILNLAAAFFVKRFPFAVDMLLFAFNACFAGFLSWYFTEIGKERIQYGWALVAAMSLFAMSRLLYGRWRERSAPEKERSE
jgi:hypothetical protein